MRDSERRPLRIAAIGYGDIAQRKHFPDLLALAGKAELMAIHGRDPTALAACAASFGVPAWHTDVDAILGDATIDAVLVLTAPDSHSSYAQQVIRAGKHLMIEKPLVRTAAEAAELLAVLQRQQAIRPITCFPLPHVETEDHLLARRLLQAGAIGEVTGVECYRGHRGPTHAGWFYERERAGGGVLIDLGIYQLSAMVNLFGPAARMTAACTRRFAERTLDDGSVVRPDVEDSALLTLSLASGVDVLVNASWNGCLPHYETRARVVAIGRQGMMYFGARDRNVHVYRPDGEYGALPEAAVAAEFDGYACRRIAPAATGVPASIVGAFVDRILAADTGMAAMAIQAHVLEIVEKAYLPGRFDIELTTRF